MNQKCRDAHEEKLRIERYKYGKDELIFDIMYYGTAAVMLGLVIHATFFKGN